MNQTPTVKADRVAPVRPGLLGLGVPGVPSNMGPYGALIELSRRTGHSFELVSSEFGFYVWDTVVGDAAGEGATRDEALESALGNV
jgi:hypothetical protein